MNYDRIPVNLKNATSGAARVRNEWSEDRTSIPISSGQEDELEFVVGPKMLCGSLNTEERVEILRILNKGHKSIGI